MSCEGHSHDHEHQAEESISLHDHIDLSQVFCLNEHTHNAGRRILKSYVERFNGRPTLQSQRDPDELPELLLHVPFTEAVKVHSISIQGLASLSMVGLADGEPTSAPCTVRVFVNRSDLDFEMAREDLEPAAIVHLAPPEHMNDIIDDVSNSASDRNVTVSATLDYPLRPAGRFQSCTSISLYFGGNFASMATDQLLGHGSSNNNSHQEASVDFSSIEDGEYVPTEISYVGFKGIGTSHKRRVVKAIYETRGMKKDHKVPEGNFGASHGFT
eukprot:CAMPEP_0184859702 /NCGR_PEP_ID=MMETSP0580-20130426/4694_1 /TAXON_ID=1118495 /ORGANISM="Dactyliosolen fragilissimus" /LENGTH=270 /DNA_ID=CAMNT_0027356487 /DNA_START=11 /DNA_END=823 /DNA_ORIENTATION=-